MKDNRKLDQADLDIGRDLQKKCAQDSISAAQRNVELCDSYAMACFVGVGGVIGASGVLMGLISRGQIIYELPGQDLHDFALLAMLFAWHSDRKTEDTSLQSFFPLAIKQWESITNKKFDVNWLREPLAVIAREAQAT